jgi:hypothetical protein
MKTTSPQVRTTDTHPYRSYRKNIGTHNQASLGLGEGITGSEVGGSGAFVEAAVEMRRASGAVDAEARRRGERKQRWRGTFRAGARPWRRSSDAMGGGGARSGREAGGGAAAVAAALP